MTREEILEQQVEALEKLLRLKQAIIDEQSAKISKLEIEKLNVPGTVTLPWVQPFQPVPMPMIPSVWTNDPCIDPSGHVYPNPWFGTQPAPCNKCGKTPGNHFTITSGTTFQLSNPVAGSADDQNSNNVLSLSNAVKK